MLPITISQLRNDSLVCLNHSQSETARATASRDLVDLGVVYNGTCTNDPTYVEIAPWVRKALADGWMLWA
jgi:hypothetical protein